MKKFFLFAAALMLSVSMFAGDGSTKANAIEYNWTTGTSILPKKDHGLWYKVDLNEGNLDLYTSPEANLVIANPTSEQITLTVTCYVGDETQVKTLDLNGGQAKHITISAALLLRMGITNVYLFVETNKDIVEQVADEQGHQPGDAGYTPTYNEVAINVNVSEAGSVLFTPVPFVWDADNNLNANKETWYEITLPAAVDWDAQMVKLSARNLSTAAAEGTFGFSATCPATGITEQTRTLGAGATVTKTIDGTMLEAMSADGKLYVRAKANQALALRAEVIDIPAGTPVVFDATTNTAISLGNTYTQANGEFFSMEESVLNGVAKTENLVVTITNNSGSELTLHGDVAVNNPTPYSAQSRDITIAAGQTYRKVIDRDLYKGLTSGDKIYGMLTANGDYSFVFTTECKDELPCADAANLSTFTQTTTSFVHNMGKKWYRVDITAAKDAQQNLILTVTPTNMVNLNVDIALDCACGAAMQNYKSTLDAEATKLLSYSLYKDITEQYIYIRVDADEQVTISVEPEAVIPTLSGAWDEASAWSPAAVPATNAEVRVVAGASVPAGYAAQAEGIEFYGADATLTVAGTLTVGDEGIKGVAAANQLVVEEGAQIIFSGAKNTTPNATVKKTIVAKKETEGRTYQAIALPVSNVPAGLYDHIQPYVWVYNSGWQTSNSIAEAFKGYLLVSAEATAMGEVSFTGKSFGNADKQLSIVDSKKADYLFGNSYLANINLSALCGVVENEVFVLNNNQWETRSAEVLVADASKNLPIGVAEAFAIRGYTNHNITLSYNDMVLAPAPAPARTAAASTKQVRLTIEAADGKSDYMYLAEGEDYTAGKMLNNRPNLNVYAKVNGDICTMVRNENLIGTTVTLESNNSTSYTLRAELVSGDALCVKDLVTSAVITLAEGTEYTFNAEANKTHNRFQVVGIQHVTTGVENTTVEGANKFIENGQMVILRDGIKYNAQGQIIK